MKQILLPFYIGLTLCSSGCHSTNESANSSTETLGPRKEAMVRIGLTTGRCDLPRLRNAINEGLDNGLTINEIKEELIQAYAYCGFPRSLRAITTLMEVIDERQKAGRQDPTGRESSPVVAEGNKYDRGAKILSEMSGADSAHPKTGFGAFAPTIDVFLKEHLFCDIFERDLLTRPERELITVSVLCGIGRVEPMVGAHMQLSRNVGVSKEELLSVVREARQLFGGDEFDEAWQIAQNLK